MTQSQTKEELKPCPFCGGLAKSENYITEGKVWCKKCKVNFIIKHNNKSYCGNGKELAIIAWQTRRN